MFQLYGLGASQALFRVLLRFTASNPSAQRNPALDTSIRAATTTAKRVKIQRATVHNEAELMTSLARYSTRLRPMQSALEHVTQPTT